MIDGTIWTELNATIAREVDRPTRKCKSRGTQTRESLSDDRSEILFKACRIAADVSPLRGRQVIRDGKLFVDHWATMGVTRIEQQVRSRDAVAPPDFSSDGTGQPRGHAEQISRHQDRWRSVAGLNRERLCLQRQRRALRRLCSEGEPGHPQRCLGRDVQCCAADPPLLRARLRRDTRGQQRCHARKHVAPVHVAGPAPAYPLTFLEALNVGTWQHSRRRGVQSGTARRRSHC